MATPSLHRSFDASLVDVQRSFSSTETNSSVTSSERENIKPSKPSGTPVEAVNNTEASRNAKSHSNNDHLQHVGDIQTAAMISKLVQDLQTTPSPSLAILDFGCGTGRTTLKLLQCNWIKDATIEAWDLDPTMLAIARTKCTAASTSEGIRSVKFREMRLHDLDNLSQKYAGCFDGVVSNLALEHFPPLVFWDCVQKLLKPGGRGAVSSVHSEDGMEARKSERVVGKKLVNGINETVAAVEKAGLTIIGDVKEVIVTDEQMPLDGVARLAGSEWVGQKIWFGLEFRKGYV